MTLWLVKQKHSCLLRKFEDLFRVAGRLTALWMESRVNAATHCGWCATPTKQRCVFSADRGKANTNRRMGTKCMDRYTSRLGYFPECEFFWKMLHQSVRGSWQSRCQNANSNNPGFAYLLKSLPWIPRQAYFRTAQRPKFSFQLHFSRQQTRSLYFSYLSAALRWRRHSTNWWADLVSLIWSRIWSMKNAQELCGATDASTGGQSSTAGNDEATINAPLQT